MQYSITRSNALGTRSEYLITHLNIKWTRLNLLQTHLNPFDRCFFHPFNGKSLVYVFPCRVTNYKIPLQLRFSVEVWNVEISGNHHWRQSLSHWDPVTWTEIMAYFESIDHVGTIFTAPVTKGLMMTTKITKKLYTLFYHMKYKTE